jgi:hypothetical protein
LRRGSTGSPLTDYISNILFVSTLTPHNHLRKRESRTREAALSDIRPDSRVGRHLRRRGRVVDRARLESVYRATYRGFESLRLRHSRVSTPPEITRETRNLLRVMELFGSSFVLRFPPVCDLECGNKCGNIRAMRRLSASAVMAATRPGRMSDGDGLYRVIKAGGAKHESQWLSTSEAFAFPQIGDVMVNDSTRHRASAIPNGCDKSSACRSASHSIYAHSRLTMRTSLFFAEIRKIWF